MFRFHVYNVTLLKHLSSMQAPSVMSIWNLSRKSKYLIKIFLKQWVIKK